MLNGGDKVYMFNGVNSFRKGEQMKIRGKIAGAILFGIVLVVGLGMAVTTSDWLGRLENYQDIGVQEAHAIISYKMYPNVTILDVRTPDEYNGITSPGHIAGAINIPWDQLDAYLNNGTCPLIGSEHNVTIAYCRVGARSARACEILYEHGFSPVYNMLGGITDWTGPPWNYPVGTATYVMINVTEAYKMIRNGSSLYGSSRLLVDVRTTAEYDAQHIVNSTADPVLSAINIPWVDGSELISSSSPLYGYNSDPIIVYCLNISTCAKSGLACQYLVDHGFTRVYDLAAPNGGGIAEWVAEGYPTAATAIAGTFGYTSVGGSAGHWGQDNTLWGSKFTSPSSAGTVTKISCYGYAFSGTTSMTAYIYSDNAGAPGSKLATSSEVTGIGTTASWINFTINHAFTANTAYWLVVMQKNNAWVYWDSGSANQMHYDKSETYPNAPNTWSVTTGTQPWKMSIYATYTSP